MDRRLAVTQRGGQLEAEDGSNPYHTTQDTDRDLPLFTTAPPYSGLNHHPPFKPYRPNDPRVQSHEQYFQDSGGAAHHPTVPSSSSHLLQDPSTQLVPHEDASPFSDIAAPRTTTLASSAAALTQPHIPNIQHNPSAETQRRSTEEPPISVTVASLTTTDAHTSTPPASKELVTGDVTPTLNNKPIPMKREKERSSMSKAHATPGSDVAVKASSVSGDLDDETTTSTIITTTVITTMQTSGTIHTISVTKIYIISHSFLMPDSRLFTGLPALLVPKDVGFEMLLDKYFCAVLFDTFNTIALIVLSECP